MCIRGASSFLWGVTVTCCHHFLTFHSHLHPQESCSCPCSAIEIALVLASEDLFLLIPRRLTSLQHFTQSLILNPFLLVASLEHILLWKFSYSFGLCPIPLVILFQSPSSHLFLSSLSLMLDLKLFSFSLLVHLCTFSLNVLHLLPWYHYHPYADGSQSWPLSLAQT